MVLSPVLNEYISVLFLTWITVSPDLFPLPPVVDDVLLLLHQLEDKTLFHEEFVHYLKYAMIVYKREPAVENVIEFVARFATSFQSPPKTEEEQQQENEDEEEEEEEDEDDHPFLSFIFNFLLEV